MNKALLEWDSKAKQLAATLLRTEATLLPLLMEMKEKRVLAALNYTGIFDYCVRALGLSRSQAFYYQRVAAKAVSVPALKDAVVSGKLTLSKARRLTRIIDESNCESVIELAATLDQKTLEAEVARRDPKSRQIEKIRPVDENLYEMTIYVPRESLEDEKVLSDVLSDKLRYPVTHSEVVVWALDQCRKKHDPLKQKVSSRTLAQQGSGRKPVRKSTTQALIQRDGKQCTFIGQDKTRCGQTRWLHRHHIHEVRHGGRNTLENLTLLCSAHHQLHHEGLRR